MFFNIKKHLIISVDCEKGDKIKTNRSSATVDNLLSIL